MKPMDDKEYGREHNLPDLDTLPPEFWINRVLGQLDEILKEINSINEQLRAAQKCSNYKG